MAILDDFRRLELWKGGSKTTQNGGLRQDKGHARAWQAFLAGIRQGVHPIPYPEYLAVAELTIRLMDALRTGQTGHDVKLG
jgi:hypothetical protein